VASAFVDGTKKEGFVVCAKASALAVAPLTSWTLAKTRMSSRAVAREFTSHTAASRIRTRSLSWTWMPSPSARDRVLLVTSTAKA
jgi:hypothetical protein